METDIPKAMFQISTTNQHMMAYFDRYLKDYQDTITEVFWGHQENCLNFVQTHLVF